MAADNDIVTHTHGRPVMCGVLLLALLVVEARITVSAGACGMVGGITKIVGGQTVGSLQFPWYVALVSPSSAHTLQVSCGGSLITSRHVLSAAHCFPSTSGVRPEQLYRAVLGLVNRCSVTDAEQVTIIRVRVHPEFNPQTLQADVSVLTLERAVSYTPVCLPPRGYHPSGPALVIGFGSTLAKSQYPCTLQQAQVNIFSRRQCARSNLAPEYSHVPGTFCAGVANGGVDSCDGDSGGPIMTEGPGGAYVVQGIVSFGEGCARRNLPGVYTKVSAYIDFIDSATSTEGEGDVSSTLVPPDSDLSPSTPKPSFLDTLLALLGSWLTPDSTTSSSLGYGAAPGGSDNVAASRPLSPLEHFLLQLFGQTRYRGSSSSWTLG